MLSVAPNLMVFHQAKPAIRRHGVFLLDALHDIHPSLFISAAGEYDAAR